MDSHLPPPPPAPLPEPLPDAEPTLVEVGRRRGRLVWAAAFVAVVALIGGIVVLAGQDDDIDADEALTRAQEFLDDAESYRFELLSTNRTQTGDPDGAGVDSTSRSVTRATVAAKDRWAVVEEISDRYMFGEEAEPWESRRIGDVLYSNGAGDLSEGTVGPQWSTGQVADITMGVDDYAEQYSLAEEFEDDFYDDPSYRLDALLHAYLLPLANDPRHVERLVDEAAEPAVEEKLADGGVRLRAELAPIPEIAETAKEPVPPVDLVLDLDEARRPAVARFDVAVEGASETVEVRFSDWGAALTVAPPADGEIDHTPWIEEEWLATLDPALLLAPATLPGELELSSVYVYPSYDDESTDELDCPSVDLTFGRESDATFFESLDEDDFEDDEVEAALDAQPYLDISISTADCAAEMDDTGFDEEFAGLPARSDDDGYLELLYDGRVLTISSDNLSEADLVALVGSLRPVSVAELAAAIPEWARDESSGGGYWRSGPPMVSTGGVSGSFQVDEAIAVS